MAATARRVAGALALLVLLAGAGLTVWRLAVPVELVPERVVLVLQAPGARFYLGDEYLGEGEASLTAADEERLPRAVREFDPGGLWNPERQLQDLFPGERIRVVDAASKGLSTTGGGDAGFHAGARLVTYSSRLQRGEQRDQFLLVDLRRWDPLGVDGEESLARWQLRGIQGDACAMELGGLAVRVEILSSPFERWLRGRVRFALRCESQWTSVPRAAADGDRSYVEELEARRLEGRR